MNYSLITFWHERQRFLPAVLAVAFSALLIALQGGLLVGLLELMSTPVDHAAADVWVGHPKVRSVDLGQPIPAGWRARLAKQPEVTRVDPCVLGFAYWVRPADRGAEACLVIGARLDRDSLGLVRELKEATRLRARLAEPGTVVVDQSDLGRLGLGPSAGECAEINEQRVRVVGRVRGLKSLGGPYVFCSVETARQLLRLRPDQATFLLGRCPRPGDAERVAERLAPYGPMMSAFTRGQLSRASRLYWLFTTKAGIAMGCGALLGLLVGAVVTSQTLYAATAASLREYAVLQAQGIPRWRVRAAVLAQSFWVGAAGVALAVPAAYLLAAAANGAGTRVHLGPELMAAAAGVTLLMALASGLTALRSLRLVQPAQLLR